MTLTLLESDRPRTFSSKLAEYVQKPARLKPSILKDQVKTSRIPSGGTRIDFAVRQGSPFPIIYSVLARANNDRGSFEEMIDYDHIGPFSTDDWVLEIRGWQADSVVLQIGIEPFEIKVDDVTVRSRQ